MKVYAVIDTNVLVSAMLAVRPDSATVRVLEHLVNGDIVPMFNAEIVAEYREVLRRLLLNIGKCCAGPDSGLQRMILQQ